MLHPFVKFTAFYKQCYFVRPIYCCSFSLPLLVKQYYCCSSSKNVTIVPQIFFCSSSLLLFFKQCYWCSSKYYCCFSSLLLYSRVFISDHNFRVSLLVNVKWSINCMVACFFLILRLVYTVDVGLLLCIHFQQ